MHAEKLPFHREDSLDASISVSTRTMINFFPFVVRVLAFALGRVKTKQGISTGELTTFDRVWPIKELLPGSPRLSI